MRVLLLGATGGIGRLTLPRLLAAGYGVTTLSRRADAIAPADGVEPIVGDVTDPTVMDKAVNGQDAVISTLGVSTIRADRTVSTGARHTIAAMQAAGVSRLLAVTGNGLGVNGGPFVDRLLTPVILRHVKADAQEQEALISASGLGWTIVRPFRLVNRSRADRYQVAEEFSPTRLLRWTTREHVAQYLVAALSNEQSHQRVVWIASGGR